MNARKLRKRPRDPNQLAKLMVDIASGEVSNEEPEPATKRARSGHARAVALTAEQRQAIAKRAAQARWGQASGA